MFHLIGNSVINLSEVNAASEHLQEETKDNIARITINLNAGCLTLKFKTNEEMHKEWNELKESLLAFSASSSKR